MTRIYFKGLLWLILICSSTLHAATITVNSDLMDENASDGLCTLVEAVIAANDNLSSGATSGECMAGDLGTDEIIFELANGVSVIETQGNQLNVFEALEVTGPGADLLTLDAQQQGIFFFTRAALSISGLTFENALGHSGTVVYQADPVDLSLSDCVINNNVGHSGSGGVIRALGGDPQTHLTIAGCVFSNNSTLEYGGAISINSNNGRLIDVQINDSIFYNNTTLNDSGGAISAYLNNEGAGMININNSRFEQNSTTVNGGALYLRGVGLSGRISQSTFYDNHAGFGGGAVMWFDSGEFHSINNTFYENTADLYAGAIYARPNVPARNTRGEEQLGIHFINNTITNNHILTDQSGLGGGGLYSRNNVNTFTNTVIAANTTQNFGPDCTGFITTLDYNLIGNRTDCGVSPAANDQFGIDVTPIDPMFDAFTDDGDLHVYLVPAENSPLVDAGNVNGCVNELGVKILRDQIGSFRHQDGSQTGDDRCDIGAIEVVNDDVIFKDVFE